MTTSNPCHWATVGLCHPSCATHSDRKLYNRPSIARLHDGVEHRCLGKHVDVEDVYIYRLDEVRSVGKFTSQTFKSLALTRLVRLVLILRDDRGA